VSCCEIIANGAPLPPSGGGGGSSGDAEVLWAFDWSEHASEDYQAGGDGTYNVGGIPVEMVNMAAATQWENVNGTGLVAGQGTGITSWQGATPTAPHFYFQLGDLVSPDVFKAARWWAFWWEIPAWSFSTNSNALWCKGFNTGTDFGASCGGGGGWRRNILASGVPPTNYQNFSGTTGTSIGRFPLAETFNVLGIVVWTRFSSISIFGGPSSSWLDLTSVYQMGNNQDMGAPSAFTPGGTFVNPWGGRIYWGLSTETSNASTLSATVRRQAIQRGPFG
jgi:hypothetical protein